jgi:phytoene dehydrogenase-like protein
MSSHNRNHHVVVLGGGITGLSAAFYLARKHPTVQITLVEKSTRFGGWVRSERVQVCDSHGNRARVLLEAGPRTIRPNAKSVLELVRNYFHSILFHTICNHSDDDGRYTSWTCAPRSSTRPARRPRVVIGSCTSRLQRD